MVDPKKRHTLVGRSWEVMTVEMICHNIAQELKISHKKILNHVNG